MLPLTLVFWLAAFVLGVAAQPPADFSGRWRLDEPEVASTPAVPVHRPCRLRRATWAAGGDRQSPSRRTRPDCASSDTVFSRYDLQPPLTFVYPLDGSEGRNAVMMGRGEQVESSRARWDGTALIIVTTFRVEDRAAASPFTAELTRKLHLESPTSLVVEVTRAGVLGGPGSTTRSVYRKAAAP